MDSKDRQRQRDECFGLPGGNIIVPIIIGFFLILAGLSSIFRFQFWQYFWPNIDHNNWSNNRSRSHIQSKKKKLLIIFEKWLCKSTRQEKII